MSGLVVLTLCLATVLALPGCSGCRKTPEQIRAEKEKKEAERRAKELEREKKKPDLEPPVLVSLPCQQGARTCYYKPGHWTAAALATKANNFDVVGDLELSVVDGKGKPMPLAAMPFTATVSRQASLPKGQAKDLQSVFHVPRSGRPASVLARINARTGMRGVYEHRLALARMPSHQYHLVVLARWPQSYKYLDGLDSVGDPSALDSEESQGRYYRVHLLRTDKGATLPEHALFWTSIACVLWDEADPTALLPNQQQALLDWLHWGGQLIVSGPDSLDGLRNSFLSPYLPAASTATRPLTAADFEEMNRQWTLPRGTGQRLAPVAAWAGVAWDVHPQAREVPGTGGLLVERRVGRGRIVVSAFELDHPELTNWPSFDGFFNACLLGRPPRTFREEDLAVRAFFTSRNFGPSDAWAVCKLRYFARDAGNKEAAPAEPSGPAIGASSPVLGFDDLPSPQREVREADVGSWSDFNDVARHARTALKDAARIEIPEPAFVIWVVGVYLLVLVPANWLVFRALGRVEWAWAAAPVIAVIYTAIVIRLAQLDIGFARSSNEIDIVEIQGEYPRAHVTRYAALYTSLSTGYEVRFEDPGAQVQPFPDVDAPDRFQTALGETPARLEYRYGTGVRMRGLRVMSNTTRMIHGEQMVDLGGAILLADTPGGGCRLTNGTDLTLQGAGVIRKARSGEVQAAWIGTLGPRKIVDLAFGPPQTDVAGRLWPGQRSQSPITQPLPSSPGDPARGVLNLSQLVGLAESPQALQPGDVRLVAWLDEKIPGMEIRPAAPQARHAALVVAHLRYGFGEDPRPDTNTRVAVEGNRPRVLGPDASEFPEGAIP